MSPVELGYSLSGESVTSVTAQDGILATVDTPAGRAFASVDKQGKSWFTRISLHERFGTLFPHERPNPYNSKPPHLYHGFVSIFEFWRLPKLSKIREERRTNTYATPEGEVVIYARATTDPST
jgi:hypothetical protein